MARLRRTEWSPLAGVGYWDLGTVFLDALERGDDRDHLERAFRLELDELETITVPVMIEDRAAERGDPDLVAAASEFLAAVEDHDDE